MTKKAVLAYSGGLDTSVTIRWLIDEGYEVTAVAVDVGQQEDFDQIVARGKAAGAADVRVIDAVDRYAGGVPDPRDQGERAVRAEVPDGERARAPVHRRGGREGRPGDRAPPRSRTAAPARATTRSGSRWASTSSRPTWRCWRRSATPTSRARRRSRWPPSGGSRSSSVVTTYSVDENLWGRTAECGPLEDPWVAPPEDAFARTAPPAERPTEPTEVAVTFDRGLPVALDGVAGDPARDRPRARHVGWHRTGSAGST